MPKRYDRTLGWVEDSLGLAHSRELDAWVRGDGVIRFKDGRVLTLDSLQGEEAKQAREAQRRAAKLQKQVAPAAAPPPAMSPVAPPTRDSLVPNVPPPPAVAKMLGLGAQIPGNAANSRPAPKVGGLDSFAALLRGGG